MEEKAREIEREVLDKYYLNFELLDFSDEHSIPFLLKAYGDFERHWDNLLERKYSDHSIRTFLFSTTQGVGQCLKWINASSQNKQSEIPGPKNWNDILVRFLTWGMDYYMIAQQYVAWSRKLIEISIDENKKKVLFLPPEEGNYYFMLQQQHIHHHYAPNIYDKIPSDKLSEIFRQWFNEIDTHPIPFPIAGAIDWGKAKNTSLYSLVSKVTEELIFAELPQNTDLCGYTIQDFRHFYSILFINFSFIKWIEGLMDEKLGSENPYGSNPIDFPEKDMIEFLSDISSIDTIKVESIVSDLTFDVSSFHSSILFQPIIRSKSNRLYLLPNLIASIDPNRMLTSVLNKSKRKKIYDGLINQIEKFQLNRVREIFQLKSEWITLLEKRITVNNKTYVQIYL